MKALLKTSILVVALGLQLQYNLAAQDRRRPQPRPEAPALGPREPDRGQPRPEQGPDGDATGTQPLIVLEIEPPIVYEGDEVTVRWEVRDPRDGIAWGGPVALRCSNSSIRGLPDPTPVSGSFTFTAERRLRRGTFTLTVGGPLSPVSREAGFVVLELPVINSLTTEIEIGGFRDEVSGHPGDLLGIIGRGFGDEWRDDKVFLSINGRLLALEIREWTDTRIGARIPDDVPVADWTIFGDGSLQVVKAPLHHAAVLSNAAALEIVRKVPEPVPPLTFGAPRIVRPMSSGSNPRDLSDHWGVAVDVTYRPHAHVRNDDGRRQLDQPAPIVFTLFTYNIAQVPVYAQIPGVGVIGYEGDRDPMANVDDIARHLNEAQYGIVCLQEAFSDEARRRLLSAVEDRYREHRSGPRGGPAEEHSGLLILTSFRIVDDHREKFPEGSGLDDSTIDDLKVDHYTAKGVLHTRIRLTGDAADTIDVFTTHTDSGSAEIRADQFALIGDFIAQHARGGTWILAGDLNVRGDRQQPSRPAEDQYSRMMESLGMPRDLWTASYFLSGEPGYTFDPDSSSFSDDDSGGRKRLDYILVGVPKPQPAPPTIRSRD